MFSIGAMCDNGDGVDFAKAMEWWRRAAAAGSARAMYNVGRLYGKGQGAPRNYAEAMEWYRKAAARSNDEAIFNIGWLYDHGCGVPQDYTKAMAWWRKSAAAGDGMEVIVCTGIAAPQDVLLSGEARNLCSLCVA